MKSPSHQILEDIATGYWYGELLFTAVEMDVFSLLTTALDTETAGARLDLPAETAARFLSALAQLELLEEDRGRFRTSAYARRYLVQESPDYQGHSILWRKTLQRDWQDLAAILRHGGRYRFGDDEESAVAGRFYRYSLAMDDIARCKSREIAALLHGDAIAGGILDLGCGLGSLSLAFLTAYPQTKAVLMDMQQVLALAEQRLPAALRDRVRFHPGNVLDPGAFPAGKYSLVLLSNLVHAFDRADNQRLLTQAVSHLNQDGLLLIHDFFREHRPEKAAVMDINMLINTYNGRVYQAAEIAAQLQSLSLATAFRPLPSDTAVLLAAADEQRLADAVKEAP